MTQWNVKSHVLYNPQERFIEYVVPGVIGLILQLLTVTLTACTIARERESGTLYQLMVTSLRRNEIVIGKMLPLPCDLDSSHPRGGGGGGLAFSRRFPSTAHARRDLPALSPLLVRPGIAHLDFLAHADAGDPAFGFLFASGLCLIRCVCAARALPQAIRYLSECFPLTHFCRAFRLVNLYRAGVSFYSRRSHFSLFRRSRDFLRRGAAPQAHPGMTLWTLRSAKRGGELHLSKLGAFFA